MIHEIYKDIPSLDMAEACSEILLTNNFKYVVAQEFEDKYRSDHFPPEPAHLTSVVAAYLEGDPKENRVRRQFATLHPDVKPEEISADYRQQVGERQLFIPFLEKIVTIVPELNGTLTGTKMWCARKVGEQGGRLVAAHLTARVARNNDLIGALVIPKSVTTELPLIIRDTLVRVLPQITKYSEDNTIAQDELDTFLKAIGPHLRGEDLATCLAEIAFASILPETNVFIEAITNTPKSTPNPTNTPGEDRATRCRREREERKKK